MVQGIERNEDKYNQEIPTMTKGYTVRKRIKDTGWPVHTKSGHISKKWEKAHPVANRAARRKFGSKAAKEIASIVKRTPKGELLGKHTRSGKIIISSRVPKHLRPAIALHERFEHKMMARR